MAALPLTQSSLNMKKMEYHGNFGHTFEMIKHIALMSRIDIFTQPVI